MWDLACVCLCIGFGVGVGGVSGVGGGCNKLFAYPIAIGVYTRDTALRLLQLLAQTLLLALSILQFRLQPIHLALTLFQLLLQGGCFFACTLRVRLRTRVNRLTFIDGRVDGLYVFGGKLDADISDIIYRPLVRKVLND